MLEMDILENRGASCLDKQSLSSGQFLKNYKLYMHTTMKCLKRIERHEMKVKVSLSSQPGPSLQISSLMSVSVSVSLGGYFHNSKLYYFVFLGIFGRAAWYMGS